MKTNRLFQIMSKRSFLLLLGIVMFLIAFLFLLYENHAFSRQIQEKDAIIQRLQIRDSISSKLIGIEETDSSFIYSYSQKPDGGIYTYHELDSMVREYDYELYVKDLILVKAKNYYQFNYSIKRLGDTIILGFWNK